MPSWAGGWDNQFAQPYALLNEPDAYFRGIARLSAPQAQVGRGELGMKLTGSLVGTGGTVNAPVTQVKSQQVDGLNLGGLVPIVAAEMAGRVTTAADEVAIDTSLRPRWAPNPYPVDKSGNGGGGKLGTVN